MHIAFLNPQGNFDLADSYWTEHPDFGGQLVYVKEVALAMAAQGHHIDIITRQIKDPAWPEFAAPLDTYPGHKNARIVRIPCGPPKFLPKEKLWPWLGTDWVNGILDFYRPTGLPDIFTTHYGDGGLAGAIIAQKTGIPFTFTGHSLGAQKMDKLHVSRQNLADIDRRFAFSRRIPAERISMNRAARIIVSTRQEQMEQYSHPAYRGAVDTTGPDSARFAVIPPGVNRQVFSEKTGPLDETIRDRIDAALHRDLPPDRHQLPLVVCSSRLDAKKNHLGLAQAFAQSPELREAANLAIVVRGLDDPIRQRGQLKPEERAILDEIVSLMEQHHLRVVTAFPLNSQEELAAAYRVAANRGSVFALTAHYEPFGLAPLEAMSCGLPAVVTQNGGPAESMHDAETGREYGVLVDPADPADIARGILRVFASPQAWQSWQQAGLERVITRYTWGRTAAGYLQVIEQILTGNQPAASAQLPIPPYFTHPIPANAISLDELARLYFG